jgi:hypothetical protein
MRPWWRVAAASGAHRDGTREGAPCYCLRRRHSAKTFPVARDETAPTNLRNYSPDAARAAAVLLGGLLAAAAVVAELLGASLVAGAAGLRGG